MSRVNKVKRREQMLETAVYCLLHENAQSHKKILLENIEREEPALYARMRDCLLGEPGPKGPVGDLTSSITLKDALKIVTNLANGVDNSDLYSEERAAIQVVLNRLKECEEEIQFQHELEAGASI